MSNEFLKTQQAVEYTVSKYGVGNAKTFSKLRVTGGGCPYRKFGRQVVYAKADLDAWALNKMSAPMASTSDNGWRGKS